MITRNAVPTFELNPFRARIWLRHEEGILADVRTGPFQEVQQPQTVYDQFGNDIAGELQVFREDKLSQIIVNEGIRNTQTPSIVNDSGAFVHLGGMCKSLYVYLF